MHPTSTIYSPPRRRWTGLLWNWYVVPQYHSDVFRIAYWDRFGIPQKEIRSGFTLDDWWVDAPHAAATDAAKQGKH